MVNKPGVLKFYKGVGAAAFKVLPPRYDRNGYMTKHGAILVEAAPCVKTQQWDWNQKITFAISVADICNIVDPDSSKWRIFHKNDETNKVLEFKPGTGNYEGTWNMYLSQGQGPDRQSVMVPFSGGEHAILIRLLVSACPLLIGWSDSAIQGSSQRR